MENEKINNNTFISDKLKKIIKNKKSKLKYKWEIVGDEKTKDSIGDFRYEELKLKKGAKEKLRNDKDILLKVIEKNFK